MILAREETLLLVVRGVSVEVAHEEKRLEFLDINFIAGAVVVHVEEAARGGKIDGGAAQGKPVQEPSHHAVFDTTDHTGTKSNGHTTHASSRTRVQLIPQGGL
jgi:hypothetical protein